MQRIFILSSLLLLWLPSALAALSLPALEAVVTAVQAPFQEQTPEGLRIRDYRAGFVQESEIVSLNRLQQANGRVQVAFRQEQQETPAEVRFRWEYLQPTRQLIVSDGDIVWVYVPENNQVIRSEAADLARNRENDPMTFLTGLSRLSRDFEISWAEPAVTDAGHYRLELQPRQASALLSRLLLTIDRRALATYGPGSEEQAEARPVFPVLAATIVDTNGNRSHIRFTDIRVNTGMASEDFQFEVPPGVDVMSPADAGLNY